MAHLRQPGSFAEGSLRWNIEPATGVGRQEEQGADVRDERRAAIQIFSRYFYVAERYWSTEKENLARARADPGNGRLRARLGRFLTEKRQNSLHFIRGEVDTQEYLLAVVDHASRCEFDLLLYSSRDQRLYPCVRLPRGLSDRKIIARLFAVVTAGYAQLEPNALEAGVERLRALTAPMPDSYGSWMLEATTFGQRDAQASAKTPTRAQIARLAGLVGSGGSEWAGGPGGAGQAGNAGPVEAGAAPGAASGTASSSPPPAAASADALAPDLPDPADPADPAAADLAAPADPDADRPEEPPLTVLQGNISITPPSTKVRDFSFIVDNRRSERIDIHRGLQTLALPQPGARPFDANRPFYDFAGAMERARVQEHFDHKVGVLWQRSGQIKEWEFYSNYLAGDELDAVVGRRALRAADAARDALNGARTFRSVSPPRLAREPGQRRGSASEAPASLGARGDSVSPEEEPSDPEEYVGAVDEEVQLLRHSLQLLGHVEVLRGFEGCSGRLDLSGDTDGRFTFYEGNPRGRENPGHQVIYHVAPLIPGKRTEEEFLNPKRHVGNDPVLVVIQTGRDCVFSVNEIDSDFTKIAIVIQATFRDAGGPPGRVRTAEDVVFKCQALNHHSIVVPTPPKVTREMQTQGVGFEVMRDFIRRKIISASLCAKGICQTTMERKVEDQLPDSFKERLALDEF